LLQNKTVFTLCDVSSVCPGLSAASDYFNDLNGLGLLQASVYWDQMSGNERVSLRFLHYSIQEYLAAYHISSLPDVRQLKLLKSTFWDVRYCNTWVMFVGITKGKSLALRHFLSGNTLFMYSWLFGTKRISGAIVSVKMKCLHLFQCFAETEIADMVTLLETLFIDQSIDLSNQPLSYQDIGALGFMLLRNPHKHWKMLNLSGCNITEHGLDLLSKSDRLSVSIKRLDLSHNLLNLDSLSRIISLIESWKISEVFINSNDPFGNEGKLLRHLENYFFCAAKKNYLSFMVPSDQNKLNNS